MRLLLIGTPFMQRLTAVVMAIEERAPTSWTTSWRQNALGTKMAHLGINRNADLKSLANSDAGG
jgi:hypothetical protein